MYPAPPVTRTLRLAANGKIREAERPHLLGRVDVPAVEDDRRAHQAAHLLEVRLAELVPLGDDRQRVSPRKRIVASLGERDSALEAPLRRDAGFRIVGANRRAGLE